MIKQKNSFSTFLKLLLFGLFLTANSTLYAQTVVSSLNELMPFLDDDHVVVKMKPGIYTITSEDVKKGLYKKELKLKKISKILLLFEGNNSTYDFTGVTIKIDTKVHQSFGNFQVHELQIIGNNNVLKNLTLVDEGSVYDAPTLRATNIVMDGSHNKIEGFTVTTKGSFPYGYGDAFGKGGKSIIRHRKHSACLVRGESNHLKNSTFFHKSYGHCIFMQGANNPLIEGCYVQGEVRKTDDMLAEAGTGSPADKVDFMTVWGYKLPAGYMMSKGEAGIRAYDGGETIIDGKTYKRGTSNPTVKNCVVKNMRTGVTVAHATGKKYVENCTSLGNENGFSLGSGEVVNCRADVIYGPAYASTYERDVAYNADITILSSTEEYYNGSGNVAYIGGSGHKIIFRGSNQGVEQGLQIKVGGDKNNIRLLHGNLPNQNDFKGLDFELINLTNFPVFLSDKSSGISGESLGKISNSGTNNVLEFIGE
ncbi:hypothetical protein [Polaribacter sp. Asnod1-A03]|uniref:hypothetical protein n=1 Tax=Polaribacter sp. Asnod1-A03 TaxID=3160581 RepID=UPI00386BA566